MAQQDIENFWNMCEEQLKLHMTEFNNSMGHWDKFRHFTSYNGFSSL